MSSLTITLNPEPARSYPVALTEAPLDAHFGAWARALLPATTTRLLLVTDTNVAPLYADATLTSLNHAGFSASLLILPAGEATKHLDTLAHILGHALAAGLDRHSAFVALGGGVIGDLTGFAASVFQRGVPVLQVPTTLLAQVDSSVGGKTGVNHVHGKNLIGTFWQPAGVYASLATLATLPARELRSGLAEAVKHAFIADASLATAITETAPALLRADTGALLPVVTRCIAIKAAIVAGDERERLTGDSGRALLNFGHTFGHAYERLLGFGTWTHGEAVAAGMVLATQVSIHLGSAEHSLFDVIINNLKVLQLPHDPWSPALPSLDALIEAARRDKKATSDSVRFITLSALGRATVHRLTWDAVRAALTPWGPPRSARG